MAKLQIILGILAASAGVLSSTIQTKAASDLVLSLEPQLLGGFHLTITRAGQESEVIGHIGRTLASTFISEEIANGVEVKVGNANLTVTTWYDDESDAQGVKISWDTEPNFRLEDCIDFGNKQWYGGPMQVNQVYPIQNAEQLYSGYVVMENDNKAVMERYWLNSKGEYLYVHPEVPLFVDYHNVMPNHLCMGAQAADPYSTRRTHVSLTYDLWFLNNAKQAHLHAVDRYLGKPSDLPDYLMVQHPIWSTWAQYSQDINQNNTLEFANQIVDHGFNNSQFEIDDLWETCYGSLEIDTEKFPDFAGMVQEIKSLGFRVTLWVHPFINRGCDPWYSEALEQGYLVLTEDGSPDASWWNNNNTVSSYIDFTNPSAAQWYSDRLKTIQQMYDIDSFKFDAGESSFSPQIPVQSGDIDLHPHHIVQTYVRACAEFGNMIEVRAAFMTQDLPVFVRMVDRDSVWGLNNGLPTIVTTTLQMNLAGYGLVLPDMIGGNGFNLNHAWADVPDKELFVRWVQANTFLPALQYSYVPWNFDNETVEICKKYTDLHAAYADYIYAAMAASRDQGVPVNAPLWWADPDDEETFTIWDQFLLGHDILVAPVLEQGAVSRDIYLPEGTWLEEGDSERIHEGPLWLRDHPAPLDTLPYFLRQGAPDSASTSLFSVTLVLAGFLLNIFV